MSNRNRNAQSRLTEGTQLYLSGDFGSPAEVVGAPDLDAGQKRAILEAWRQDVLHGPPLDHDRRRSTQPGDGPARDDLLKAIDQALSDLET